MQFLDRQTARLYYEDMYLRKARARIVKIGDDFIELDATVAYPEGGGQESDMGVITTRGGEKIRFSGAKKLFGRMIFIEEFPNIQVEGIIRHLVHSEDILALRTLTIGEEVDVEIDVARRASLSLSHTASHLLYIGIAQVRPDAIAGIFGCHIKTDSARFDVSVGQRFTEPELIQIAQAANQLVSHNSRIEMYSHQFEPEARYWKCDGHIIPCGGTHIENTGAVGCIDIRRKRLGTGKERITCEFRNASFNHSQFHQ